MNAGPACPLCGGSAPKTFVRTWREWSLWECPDCGAGFCDPFREPGPAYYEGHEGLYAAAVEETTDPMSFEYDEGLARLTRTLPRGARVLDAGCGAGGFLRRLRAAGFEASGADFNPRRVRALRDLGFEVFEGGLPDFAKTGPAPFDGAAMFEIVEHLTDPAAWLAAALSVLKPGAPFVLGTPNRDRTFDPFRGPGMEEVDNPPHHLTRWSAPALRRLLERAGFEVLECRPLANPLPLVQLMLRNSLRLGLSARAAGTAAPSSSAPAAAPSAPSARAKTTAALVRAKEAVLNGAARAAYPALRAAGSVLGWQGTILFAAARRPS
jgi:SAM-dependent methyltransferase